MDSDSKRWKGYCLLLLPLLLYGLSGCAAPVNINATTPRELSNSAKGSDNRPTTSVSRDRAENFFDPLSSPENDVLHFQPGDVVVLKIVGESWGGSYKIPPSGIIDLQFIGPYKISGKSTTRVRSELMNRLSPEYYVTPDIMVNFDDVSKTRVLVLGEVQKPSHVAVRRGGGVMDALAEAGSLTQYSRRTEMFVFRNLAGDTSIYRVNYEEYARGALDHNLPLKEGDLVYVHTNFWPHFDRLRDVLQPLGFGINTLATLRFIQDL